MSTVEPRLVQTDPPALLAGSCAACGGLHFPNRGLCPECQSDDVASLPMSGAGSVFTLTIVRAAPPGYLGAAPYALGVVALSEPLRVTATLLAEDLEALRIGDPVRFELLDLGAGPAFAYRKVELP